MNADFLDGFAARLLGNGWEANPHNRTHNAFDPARRSQWRDGWGAADERSDAPALVRLTGPQAAARANARRESLAEQRELERSEARWQARMAGDMEA